ARKCFLLGATTVGRDGRLNGRSFTSRKAAARLFQISPNWRTSEIVHDRNVELRTAARAALREAGLPDYTMLRFANPAFTVAGALSNGFAGIAPGSAPGFIAAQCIGALLALLMVRYLLRPSS